MNHQLAQGLYVSDVFICRPPPTSPKVKAVLKFIGYIGCSDIYSLERHSVKHRHICLHLLFYVMFLDE